MNVSEQIYKKLLFFQKNEINEHHIYIKLASRIRLSENRHILDDIANIELQYYQIWPSHNKQNIAPD